MTQSSLMFRRAALASVLLLACGSALAQQAPAPPAGQTPPTGQAPPPAGNGTATADTETGEAADGKVLLAYRWKTDQPLRYRITTIEQNTTTGSTGNPLEAGTEKHVDLVVKPAGEAEKFRTWLDIGWERVHFKLNQGKVNFEIDTAAPDAAKAGPFAPLATAMQQIAGKTVRVKMSPGGRVEEVQGLADIANTVKNAFPADANRDAIVAALFPTTDAQLVDQLSKAIMPLPVKRVEPGFTAPQKVSLGGTDELTGQLVFSGVQGEGDFKALLVKQEMSAKPGAPQANPADKMTYVREKYDVTSSVLIDADAFAPVRFESTSTTNYVARKADSNPDAAPDKLVQQIVKIETSLQGGTALTPSGPIADPAAAAAPPATGSMQPTPGAPAPPAAPEAPAPPPAPPSAR